MTLNTDQLLALICLKVLADTAFDGTWIENDHRHLATRFRLLGIARSEALPGWATLLAEGMVEQKGSRLRLTAAGYVQSQMPYRPARPPRTWYEQAVHHLYRATDISERQVAV